MRLQPQLLIAAASAFAVLGDHVNSFVIEMLRRQAGASGQGPWDVAVLHHWGYWSHFDDRSGRSAWPLPPAVDADDLAAFGATRAALREEAVPGDIFLLYSAYERRFVRAGVVAVIEDRRRFERGSWFYDVLAIEGNTNALGDLGGPKALRVKRRLSACNGDRFLHWAALDPYVVLGSPARRTVLAPGNCATASE